MRVASGECRSLDSIPDIQNVHVPRMANASDIAWRRSTKAASGWGRQVLAAQELPPEHCSVSSA